MTVKKNITSATKIFAVIAPLTTLFGCASSPDPYNSGAPASMIGYNFDAKIHHSATLKAPPSFIAEGCLNAAGEYNGLVYEAKAKYDPKTNTATKDCTGITPENAKIKRVFTGMPYQLYVRSLLVNNDLNDRFEKNPDGSDYTYADYLRYISYANDEYIRQCADNKWMPERYCGDAVFQFNRDPNIRQRILSARCAGNPNDYKSHAHAGQSLKCPENENKEYSGYSSSKSNRANTLLKTFGESCEKQEGTVIFNAAGTEARCVRNAKYSGHSYTLFTIKLRK